MPRTFAQRMMNSGSVRERALGRALARGRSRPGAVLARILELADSAIKNNASGVTTGANVYTPTAGGDHTEDVPKHNPRTRLRVPY
jgi:hypothetical protein